MLPRAAALITHVIITHAHDHTYTLSHTLLSSGARLTLFGISDLSGFAAVPSGLADFEWLLLYSEKENIYPVL